MSLHIYPPYVFVRRGRDFSYVMAAYQLALMLLCHHLHSMYVLSQLALYD